ncbi:hypothetical protein LEP1GSC048_3555 [Leptospira santarosai serovar Shermani str. 1342KT]|nr:hypothetical protein LEP1GSC048_3555 [Leptospira santarosai serovar Shermani str. 1342KT]
MKEFLYNPVLNLRAHRSAFFPRDFFDRIPKEYPFETPLNDRTAFL